MYWIAICSETHIQPSELKALPLDEFLQVCDHIDGLIADRKKGGDHDG